MFGRKRRNAAELPPPPATFPDGSPFPYDKHASTLQHIAEAAAGTGAPDHHGVFMACAFTLRLLHDPNADEVDFTEGRALENLRDCAAWLAENGLGREANEFVAVLQDLFVFWNSPGGAAQRDGMVLDLAATADAARSRATAGAALWANWDLPDPPATFPDDTPYTGEQHLRVLDQMVKAVQPLQVTGAPAAVAMLAAVARLVCEPNGLDLGSPLLGQLRWTTEWLQVNGLHDEAAYFFAIQRDLQVFWESPGGAVSRIRDQRAAIEADLEQLSAERARRRQE